MGCRTGASGIKSVPSGPIAMEPKAAPVAEPAPDPNVCPNSNQCDIITDGYGPAALPTCISSCQTGLPLCDPSTEVNGEKICPTCIPPDAVMISATPRDPYYIDELAIAMDSGDQTKAIRITLDRDIPLVRPVSFRHAALPGTNGVPNNVRSDIESHELEHEAINMYATIPQENSERREVAVIDRFNNRWVIVNSITQSARPIYHRVSRSHFSRGRGVAPWWKTGFPDGSSSTGVG